MPEFTFGFGELPEEIQDKLKQEMDRHQMATDAMQHDVSRFFRELSVDHLKTLRFLMHACSCSAQAAAFYEGVAATHLTLIHNVCACGEDHDADAHALLEPSEDTKLVALIEHPDLADDVKEVAGQMREQVNAALASDPNTGPYNLKLDENDNYVCANCGKPYPSLDDRMLRPPGPDGCPGCVDKAKWG